MRRVRVREEEGAVKDIDDLAVEEDRASRIESSYCTQRALSAAQEALLDRIEAELFACSPIVIDRVPHGEAQHVDQEGRLHFGVRTGPVMRVSTVLHEMGHFVEIDEERMNTPSWGFRYPNEQYIPGRYGGSTFCEPRTMKITAREMRVMAYEESLRKHFGLNPARETIPDLVSYLPDWYNVPGRVKNEGSRERWVLAHFDRLVRSRKYSYASFVARWTERNAKLWKLKPYRKLAKP